MIRHMIFQYALAPVKLQRIITSFDGYTCNITCILIIIVLFLNLVLAILASRVLIRLVSRFLKTGTVAQELVE